MVRAIYRNGQIQLLDDVPSDWRDGDEVVVRSISESSVAETDERPMESFDEWAADLREATKDISDEDHAQFMAALDQVEKESKELGRREMEKQDRLFDEDVNADRIKEAG
jgi:hypothetical protein